MYRGTNDPKVAQYQRAVTPTIDPPQPQAHLTGSVGAIGSLAAATAAASSGSTSATIRGKVLSYNPPSSRSNFRTTSTVQPTTIGSSNTLLNNHNAQFRTGHAAGTAPPDITVQGVRSSGPGPTSTGRMNSLKPSEFHDQLSTLSMLPRYDLIPLVDEIPPDGIIFAKIKPNSASYAHVPSDTLVVFRTSEERLRNPERLNLDRRQLDHCPLLEQEQRLRLLNYQNNNIKFIANLENLPNLIFLDLYNNKIITLDGPISVVKGLRVLMAGKNRISRISNLTSLKKLDVLDLHSNDIRVVEGLDGLTDLRVLNLAGNKIAHVDNLNTLTSLTELNLRRNNITHIFNLQHLPALQRIFLSHNQIMHYQDIACVFSIANLIELSLDNNPVADKDPSLYRFTVLSYLSSLKHLDLKRVTEDERSLIQSNHLNLVLPPLLSDNSGSPPLDVPPSDALRDDDRSESDRNSASPPLQEDIGSGGNTEVTGKNRAQSPSANDQPVSSAELIASSDSMDDQEGVTGIAVPGNTIPDGAFEAKTGGGLAALARAGRISKSQSVFDIEILGPEEKILIASGEKWELNIPRKLLLGVTEMCLLHLRREQIVQKTQALSLNTLACLKCLRFLFNDFSSLKQVEFIPALFGTVEHLYIQENPINESAEVALSSFLIAHMPRLVSFNDMAISSVDRRNAEQQWLSMDSWRNKAIKTFQNRVPTTTAFGSTEKESKGEDSGNVESSAPVPSISAESGDFDTVVIQRAKPSSLASLLKHSREYNTGNSPLKSQTPVNPPPPSPWQQSAQNHIAYNVFSQEFDRLVHAIIFDTLKDLPKPA